MAHSEYKKPSVAVVGSGTRLSAIPLQENTNHVAGLAGLTAAYLLSSSEARTGLSFDVHLFEKVSVFVKRHAAINHVSVVGSCTGHGFPFDLHTIRQT